jgi:hypothetical protein
MLGFIFGRPDNRNKAIFRMAEELRAERARATNSFANCTWNGQRFNGNPTIDLVEIDGVWQMLEDK